MKQLEGFDIERFRNDLIQWYTINKRDLPWRKTKDPYRIWVSEIMLQQTKVDTVIPYYQAFMRKFPTQEALAAADEEDVLKMWEGLGYYARAQNLHAAVREVVEHYGGVVPKSREEMLKLKGVGPYTAGAILSIAYDLPEPAVDGNVMRVISRLLFIEDDIKKAKTKKLFEDLLYVLICKDDPSSFNQGLMELGALVCTPRSPGCLLCPVREHCRAYARGLAEALPRKAKKKMPKETKIAALIIRNDHGEIWIEKRPEKGLLAGLWQIPNVEIDDSCRLEDAFLQKYKIRFQISEPIQTLQHEFSHLIWMITVYETQIEKALLKENEQQRWMKREEIERFAFPVSHQKIIEHSL